MYIKVCSHKCLVLYFHFALKPLHTYVRALSLLKMCRKCKNFFCVQFCSLMHYFLYDAIGEWVLITSSLAFYWLCSNGGLYDGVVY